ncbi:MAG TPA: peptidylprolyl isomerase [Povalibacter sp.]|nr:peptidylprolyl isomerase [Povalibacter sp.]
MSTTLPTASLDAYAPADTTQPRQRRPMPGWLREPLLHFVVLGGLLFAVDHVLISRTDDPRTIVVGPEVDREAIEVFATSRGRKPDAKELEALHRVWLDNEVLYREGLAMQVDKGDDAIRERVIFKALSVIDANVRLPPVDDKVLREWFENHRDKYDEPERYTFQEAALSGDTSESAVRAFVSALNSGTPGDAEAGLRIFKDRPHANLVQSYGAEFPQELAALPPGQWRALQTRNGWRAMRLDAITPPRPAVYEAYRGVVLQDWKDEVASELRTAAVRALAKKYKVIFAGAAQ